MITNISTDLVSKYDDAVFDNITKECVNIENYNKLKIVYDELIEYKIIVNSIDSLVESISKSSEDIKCYIQYNYPYCDEYLKIELSKFMSNTKIGSIKYDKNTISNLVGIKKSIDNKLNSFLNKNVKINKIVTDYNNLDNNIEELIKNKFKPENINLEDYIYNMKLNINMSIDFLKKGDYNNALLYHGKYMTMKLINK